MRAKRIISGLALVLAMSAGMPAFGGEPGTAPAAVVPASKQRQQHWFGVAVENIPPSIAKQLKLKPGQGLMVSTVLPNSPAERAGLKPEDLLIAINDQPLTAQDDLYHAANPKEPGKARAASRITYLREGDRAVVEIMPAPRPMELVTFDTRDNANATPVRNYVAPNGGGAQVSPGYRINLATSDPSDFTVKSIQQIVSKGQTVVLSQETDAAGNLKKTITVGTTVYPVDPQHLDALPEDLRGLAKSWPDGGTKVSAAPATAASLEQRVKELEARNAELMKRLDQLAGKDEKAPRK